MTTSAPAVLDRGLRLAAAASGRWKRLPARLRWVLAVATILVVYIVFATASGKHGWIHKHAPIGFVLVGVVYGSVNALGAMGLILVYRANRFINFAHGALGSLVGVLAIGLVKVHGLNYWIALPLAVAVGVLVGGLTEMVTIRRFNRSPRLIVTVASIGLAQVFGGAELFGSQKEHFTA